MKTLALLVTIFVGISFSSFALINGAPPRVHPSSNAIIGIGNSKRNFKTLHADQLPEEELESLKANSKSKLRLDLHKEFPFDTTNAADKRSSDSASAANSGATEQQKPIASLNTKLPVNEETPTASDNANSEKFRLPLPPGAFAFFSPSKSEDKRRLVLPGMSSLMSGSSPSRFNGYDNLLNSNGLDTDYTPQDIAEYIFWTGDEKSVSQALNEFFQEGLVSRDDAVGFWEDVKLELALLKNRYSIQTQQQVNQDTNSLDFSDKWSDYKAKIRRSNNGIFHDMTAVKKQMNIEYGSGDMGLYDMRNRDNNIATMKNPTFREKPQGIATSTLGVSNDDVDYEELVGKLRQADAKFREYSLEGVIYQLAKELFSQGLQEQPQVSIQRFARFIEGEAAEGHIPKDLEKAVLDTLVSALMDAVSERGISRAGAQINPPPKPTQPQPQKLL